MSPEKVRDNDLKALAEEVRGALGVNGNGDAAHIMEHSINQACIELEVVEGMLEKYQNHDSGLSNLLYFVMGIRGRLTLAQNGSPTLDRLLNNKPWEAVP